MSNERRVLITGATGKQGGALAQAIEGKGFRVYAMTRRPGSDAARALAAPGYDADIAGLEREFGFRTTRLPEWAATRRPSA